MLSSFRSAFSSAADEPRCMQGRQLASHRFSQLPGREQEGADSRSPLRRRRTSRPARLPARLVPRGLGRPRLPSRRPYWYRRAIADASRTARTGSSLSYKSQTKDTERGWRIQQAPVPRNHPRRAGSGQFRCSALLHRGPTHPICQRLHLREIWGSPRPGNAMKGRRPDRHRRARHPRADERRVRDNRGGA